MLFSGILNHHFAISLSQSANFQLNLILTSFPVNCDIKRDFVATCNI